MNIYLFRKYWGKHKGRLFSLILSIIMLTATAVFATLNERTELRRILHNMYNVNGNYSVTVLNVTADQEQKISQLPYINKIGKISAIGKLSIADKSYTIGFFDNIEAEEMYHTPMLKGQLPYKEGQIAIPEFILNQLYSDINIGDQVKLNYENSNGETISDSFELSGIIDNYMNRMDMDYNCKSDGITITSNEIEFPNPSIYIYPDSSITKEYTNCLLSTPDKVFFSDEYNNYQSECLDKLWEITNNIVSGKQKLVLDFMSGMDYTSEGYLQTKKTDDIKVIHLLTLLMMIVAAISMFSGIISIMPQRIESLRLLRSIGASKRKLVSIFITESVLFLIIGIVMGIATACGLHELLIHLQKMIGISAYKGYTAEYIIEQKTNSPFILPIVLSSAIAVVSLIIPIKSIISMTFYKKNMKSKSYGKAKSLNSAYSKITGTRILSIMSAISMIIVICSTVFGYCYYSQLNKGTSYLSIGNTNTEASYYLVNGIDLKKNEIDCFVSANIPKGNEIAVYEKEYGITAKEEQALEQSASVMAWGLYPALTVVYDNKNEPPKELSQSIVPMNPKWEYYDLFSENTIYDLPLLLVNETMMKTLCDGNTNDIILLSQNGTFAYDTGDTISMITCLCDETTHVQLNTMKNINVKITKQVNLKSSRIEENDILKSCGLFNFSSSYGIAMTAEKAEQLGFYNPNYSASTIKFNNELTDAEIRSYVSSNINKPVRTTTLNELKHSAKMKKISSNANSIILFILLFILCIMSIYNLLHMNVNNNLDTFSIMHSIGMSLKRIRVLFINNILKTSAIAIVIGILLSFSGQRFVASKYDQYTDLLTKQQEMSGNDAFPEVIIGFTPAEFDKTDPMYDITLQLENIKSSYMLDKELWLPDLCLPLLIICAIIFISTLLCSLISAKSISVERRRNDD